MKTDVLALWLRMLFSSSRNSISGPACLHHAFECRDLRSVLLKKIGRAGILIKGPSLKLLDPDLDQVARDVVAFGETVEGFARNEVLGDLSLTPMLWVRRKPPRLSSSESPVAPVNSQPENCPPSGAHSTARSEFDPAMIREGVRAGSSEQRPAAPNPAAGLDVRH